jgi:hypothetical protein
MTRSDLAGQVEAASAEGSLSKTMCDVQNLQVTTGVVFDQRGNSSEQVQYSYFIQGHGPFTDKFAAGTDTPELVKAAQQAQYDKLVAVGAIAAPTY